jgi:hypothetical protein
MRGWVRVVSPDAYERFLRAKRSELDAAQAFVQERVEENNIPGLGR